MDVDVKDGSRRRENACRLALLLSRCSTARDLSPLLSHPLTLTAVRRDLRLLPVKLLLARPPVILEQVERMVPWGEGRLGLGMARGQ
eukprot:756222-Hanusia_phi.AAC.3